jgi:hypothetical protein
VVVSPGAPALPSLASPVLDNLQPPIVPHQAVPLPELLGNMEPTAP